MSVTASGAQYGTCSGKQPPITNTSACKNTDSVRGFIGKCNEDINVVETSTTCGHSQEKNGWHLRSTSYWEQKMSSSQGTKGFETSWGSAFQGHQETKIPVHTQRSHSHSVTLRMSVAGHPGPVRLQGCTTKDQIQWHTPVCHVTVNGFYALFEA